MTIDQLYVLRSLRYYHRIRRADQFIVDGVSKKDLIYLAQKKLVEQRIVLSDGVRHSYLKITKNGILSLEVAESRLELQ